LRQKHSHKSIAFFADPELRIALAQLVTPRSHAEIGSGIAAASNPLIPPEECLASADHIGEGNSGIVKGSSKPWLRAK
jgi:hypothetical protein